MTRTMIEGAAYQLAFYNMRKNQTPLTIVKSVVKCCANESKGSGRGSDGLHLWLILWNIGPKIFVKGSIRGGGGKGVISFLRRTRHRSYRGSQKLPDGTLDLFQHASAVRSPA